MYFPYFRGRQYDLLALKELAKNSLISSYVMPVIEPVKLSSTLKSTLQTYKDANLPIAIILNPEVGDLSNNDISLLYSSISDCVIPAVILNESAESVINNLERINISRSSVLAVFNNREYTDDFIEMFSNMEPKYSMFPDDRKIRRTVKSNKVLFEDKFNKQSKNSDYKKNEDEFFSEDHLYYKDEGYFGFGDYSIIGKKYEDSGFAPYAVAIHIVYFVDDNILNIHHFVSDSNNDTSDVANKFYEAVTKLAKWYSAGQSKQKTMGLEALLDYAKRGYYPGLPSIKKLTIMHHLELISKYLDEEAH